ncbi:MAG: YdcF family protein [Deinococcus-Thermus bacterium]|nr:YdcF family protein [Deinococcota bacterium]
MSDALWWLLQPSGLTLAAVAFAWLASAAGARRLATGLLGLVALAWAAVVVAPVDAWLAAPLERRHPLPERLPAEVDGIVVLGGAIDGAATVERGQLALGDAGERVLAGAALARRYPDAVLAFTGVGSGALSRDFVARPEAGTLIYGDAFAERDRIVLSASASTYEDALLALRRLQPRPGETWLLVTSAWHMPRAWATFRTLGWTLVPYPVDAASAGARWGFESWPGAARRLDDVDRIVREWGAVLVYRRTGRIAPAAWDAGGGTATPDGPPGP